MKVYKITDEEFTKYGQVLDSYSFEKTLNAMSMLDIPTDGITYVASVSELESSEEFLDMQERGFGGMPIQVGYVGGNNKTLNCLEYHKSSEFNIALDDVVLVLGLQTEIKNGVFDTALCKAFLVPKGCGVDLYGTTLHYAPMNVSDKGYRVACVLPRGTNGDKPQVQTLSTEDKLLQGSNKWLMAHQDSPEAAKGSYVGLKGKNIKFEDLIF